MNEESVNRGYDSLASIEIEVGEFSINSQAPLNLNAAASNGKNNRHLTFEDAPHKIRRIESRASNPVGDDSEQRKWMGARFRRKSQGKNSDSDSSSSHHRRRKRTGFVASLKSYEDEWWKKIQRFADWYLQTRWVQLSSLFLTVLSCVMYVIFSYVRVKSGDLRTTDFVANYLQAAITMTFILDFAVSLILAPSVLRYIFSSEGFIDIISLLPIVELFNPGFHAFSFTRFLRLTKALSILRQQRIGRTVVSGDLSFNVFILGVKLTGLFFITTSIIYTVAIDIDGFESGGTSSIKYWHDAFYFSIVTLFTVGYGDISPKTPFARIVVILIIAISFILIPLEVARLADAYASIPKYRVGYKMTGKALHIILVTSSAGGDSCSGFETESLKRILEDIMHSDHGPKSKNIYVVVMSPALPSEGVANLLNSPQYKRHTVYYRGSVQNPQDLAAVRAEFADCIVLMLNKEGKTQSSTIAHAQQEQVMLSTMALMRYMGRTPRTPESLLYKVQALQRESGRTEGTRIIVVAHGNRDRKVLKECGVTVVLCREELKLAMMAQATICPAFLCFAINCLRASSTSSSGRLAMRDFLITGSTVKQDVPLEYDRSGWLGEYIDGSSYEVYSVKLSIKYADVLDGMLFCDAAKLLYHSSRGEVLLLGAMCGGEDGGLGLEVLQFVGHVEQERYNKRQEAHDRLGRRAIIMPANMQFQGVEGKLVYATIFVLGKSWQCVQNELTKITEKTVHEVSKEWEDLMYYEDESAAINDSGRQGYIHPDMRHSTLSPSTHTPYQLRMGRDHEEAYNDAREHVANTAIALDKLKAIDYEASVDATCDITKEEEKYFALLHQAYSAIELALRAHVPKLPTMLYNHVVVMIDRHEELDQYIVPLRRLRPDIRIVVIASDDKVYMELLITLDKIKSGSKKRLPEPNLHVEEVYIAKGSSRDFKVLEAASVERAKAVVLLSPHDAVGDSDTLLTSFALEQYLLYKKSRPQILVDLRLERNIYFLSQKAASLGGSSVANLTSLTRMYPSAFETRKMQSGQSIGSANSASANLRPPRKGSVSVEYKLAQKSIQANAVPTVSTVHNWPAFAAGGVWTESVMDSLCVQLYFNDDMLSFWEELCAIRSPLRSDQEAVPMHALKKGGNVHQMRLDRTDFEGKTYGDLVRYLLSRGCMPLGLYRPAGHKDAPLQYTLINPPSDEPLVFSSSLGFVEQKPGIRAVSMSAVSLSCDTVFYLSPTDEFFGIHSAFDNVV